ncbi:MAG: hypothetical protein ACI8RZ_007701 [Myxococcota bacterium]
MSPEQYALFARLHGHLGWLGLAVLLHPILLLRRGVLSRMGRLTAWLALLLITAPYAAGLWLYPTYRTAVKPALLTASPRAALAFETKEHLAFFVVMLTTSGVASALLGGSIPLTRSLLTSAWLCGLAVGILGVLIAATAHPGW